MKKVFVILIVALVVLTSASAFKFKSIGIETGAGIFTTADMVIDEVSKDFEVYARSVMLEHSTLESVFSTELQISI